MWFSYGIITRSSSAIRQCLPDELVEPFFLLAVTVVIVIGVGAHKAGYDEGHDDGCVRAWCGLEKVVCLCGSGYEKRFVLVFLFAG